MPFGSTLGNEAIVLVSLVALERRADAEAFIHTLSRQKLKLRKLDPARCKETGGIASDGVLKEVAGGA